MTRFKRPNYKHNSQLIARCIIVDSLKEPIYINFEKYYN